MNKKVIGIGAAVVAMGILITVVRSDTDEKEVIVPVVEVMQPEIGDIRLYRELVGNVEPSDVVYIYPKMAGEVKEIYVQTGDTVEAGQALCTIDTKQVDVAYLNLQAAETALATANSNLARQEVLFASGDISTVAFEQAQTAAKNAQVQYDSAKLNYDNQMEYSHITATISGKLESFTPELYENVSQQKLIGVIAGEGSKVVTFAVPEKIVKQLNPGEEILIQKNGSEYRGSIMEVDSMIDASTGLFRVKATVDDSDAIPTGSTVKLSVVSEETENAMVLPVDSVYYIGGDPYVYTYDEGIVHLVPVEVGIYDSELIEILGGIEKEEQVIITWSSELFEGSVVQLAARDESSEESAAAENAK